MCFRTSLDGREVLGGVVGGGGIESFGERFCWRTTLVQLPFLCWTGSCWFQILFSLFPDLLFISLPTSCWAICECGVWVCILFSVFCELYTGCIVSQGHCLAAACVIQPALLHTDCFLQPVVHHKGFLLSIHLHRISDLDVPPVILLDRVIFMMGPATKLLSLESTLSSYWRSLLQHIIGWDHTFILLL